MTNLELYERFRSVPEEAKKPIKGGRLKGMTDIAPMWRIKVLTETFGPCGVGWKAPITKQWAEVGADGVLMAFCNIELYVKVDGAWSDGIDGTGGATLVAKENGGLYSSDEAFKMAYTDALSVACKMLGMGADVYWDKNSKYNRPEVPAPVAAPPQFVCKICGAPVKGVKKDGKQYSPRDMYGMTGGICLSCWREEQKATAPVQFEAPSPPPGDGLTPDDELPF